MFKKYFFIVNPMAGKGKRLSFLPEISEFCKKNHLDYNIGITKDIKHATKLARQAAQKYEVVVAVGGDGTVNEVVNGIAGSAAVLGILPIGSGNDFAYQLGYKRNLKKDLRILLNGKTKKIDIGKINDQYYFINGFGIGFDGEVASRVSHFLRYVNGFLAYLMAVLRTLVTYRFRQVKIVMDNNHVIEQKILLVSVCNGTTYGGGFKVAPSAKIDDGLFSVCLVDKVGRFYALRNLIKFTKGTHIRLPEVHMYTCRSIVIESNDILAAQFDGERPQPSNKFSAKILPNNLSVITSL